MGEMGWGEGWEASQEGAGKCIHIADSLLCTAETNKVLQSNYTPILKNKNMNFKCLK